MEIIAFFQDIDIVEKAADKMTYLLADIDFYKTLASDVGLGLLGMMLYFIIMMRELIQKYGIFKFFKEFRNFIGWNVAAITIIAVSYQAGPEEIESILSAFAFNLGGKMAFLTIGGLLPKFANGENKQKMAAESMMTKYGLKVKK